MNRELMIIAADGFHFTLKEKYESANSDFTYEKWFYETYRGKVSDVYCVFQVIHFDNEQDMNHFKRHYSNFFHYDNLN